MRVLELFNSKPVSLCGNPRDSSWGESLASQPFFDDLLWSHIMGNSRRTPVSLQGQFSVCSAANHVKLPGLFPSMTW